MLIFTLMRVMTIYCVSCCLSFCFVCKLGVKTPKTRLIPRDTECTCTVFVKELGPSGFQLLIVFQVLCEFGGGMGYWFYWGGEISDG